MSADQSQDKKEEVRFYGEKAEKLKERLNILHSLAESMINARHEPERWVTIYVQAFATFVGLNISWRYPRVLPWIERRYGNLLLRIQAKIVELKKELAWAIYEHKRLEKAKKAQASVKH